MTCHPSLCMSMPPGITFKLDYVNLCFKRYKDKKTLRIIFKKFKTTLVVEVPANIRAHRNSTTALIFSFCIIYLATEAQRHAFCCTHAGVLVTGSPLSPLIHDIPQWKFMLFLILFPTEHMFKDLSPAERAGGGGWEGRRQKLCYLCIFMLLLIMHMIRPVLLLIAFSCCL